MGFSVMLSSMEPRPKKNGRPRNEEKTSQLVVSGVEPKLLLYLEDLRKMQGFGNGDATIARGFIWKEINRLIEAGRLKQR
jgi:hypothetical protein